MVAGVEPGSKAHRSAGGYLQARIGPGLGAERQGRPLFAVHFDHRDASGDVWMQASINDPVQLGISADVALFEVADRGVLIADPEAFFGGTAQIDLDFWLIGARFSIRSTKKSGFTS